MKEITEIITVQRTEITKDPKEVNFILENMDKAKEHSAYIVSEFFKEGADDLDIDVQYFVRDTGAGDKGKNEISYDARKAVYEEAIKKYGSELQIQVAIEEMSELTKELCKDIRGNGVREHIVEELADATIMLEQLRLIFDCNSEVCAEMGIKVKRLSERLHHD